jgi:two-component system, NarL family, response regulator NreC
MSVTVLLADDHPIVRQGLRHLLEAQPDFKVVGEASDGIEASQLAERYRPNVLVVDLMMPGLNGLEVTRQVRQRSPGTHIIILSMHNNEAYVLQALKNGASGYVLKDSGPAELVQAINQVMQGKRYLSTSLSERLIEMLLKQTGQLPKDPYEDLTHREREVFQLTAEGYPSSEIAERLCISPRTVEVHRSNLMNKLGLHSQMDLLRYAIRRGLVSLEV